MVVTCDAYGQRGQRGQWFTPCLCLQCVSIPEHRWHPPSFSRSPWCELGQSLAEPCIPSWTLWVIQSFSPTECHGSNDIGIYIFRVRLMIYIVLHIYCIIISKWTSFCRHVASICNVRWGLGRAHRAENLLVRKHQPHQPPLGVKAMSRKRRRKAAMSDMAKTYSRAKKNWQHARDRSEQFKFKDESDRHKTELREETTKKRTAGSGKWGERTNNWEGRSENGAM